MTEFSEFVAYRCRHCKEPCINHRDDPETETKQCRSCFSIPDLDTAHYLEDRDDLPDDQLDVLREGGTRKRSPSYGGPTRKADRTGADRRDGPPRDCGTSSGEPAESAPSVSHDSTDD